MRMWQGAVDSSLYEGIVSPAYVVARPTEDAIPRFCARLLRRPELLVQYQRVSQGNSKDTQVLKFEEFANIVVHVPHDGDEQIVIGEMFDELDSLITLHQRKHDQLATLVNQKWDFRGKLASSTTSGSTRPHLEKKQARSFKPLACCFAGRVNRIRTCDPLTPSQVRYQTAPSPVAAPWLFRTARVEMIAQHLVHATDNLCDS